MRNRLAPQGRRPTAPNKITSAAFEKMPQAQKPLKDICSKIALVLNQSGQQEPTNLLETEIGELLRKLLDILLSKQQKEFKSIFEGSLLSTLSIMRTYKDENFTWEQIFKAIVEHSNSIKKTIENMKNVN
jgi:hypothetical protein